MNRAQCGLSIAPLLRPIGLTIVSTVFVLVVKSPPKAQISPKISGSKGSHARVIARELLWSWHGGVVLARGAFLFLRRAPSRPEGNT
jgi:hypothetical protein